MIPPVLAAAALLVLPACGTERASTAATPLPSGHRPAPPPSSSAPVPWWRTPVPDPTTPLPAPTCTPEGIAIRMEVPSAAMGLRAVSVTLRNCGKRPYRLNGYPSLRVLDEEKRPFNVDIVHGTRQIEDAGPAPLTVRPGGRASFGIVWRNLVTDPTTEPVSGTYLEVRPAPGRPAVVVPSDGPLDLGNTGRLETTAWEPAPRR